MMSSYNRVLQRGATSLLPFHDSALARRGELRLEKHSTISSLPADEHALVRQLSILLGYRADTGEPVRMPLSSEGRHLYMLGGSGSGKSRELISIDRGLVAARIPGFCFIDTAGETVRDVLRYCVLARQEKRVILIDPAEKGWSVGINCLALDPKDPYGREPVEQASEVMSMLSSVFADENLNEKPQLSRWLLDALTCLAYQGYTLAHLPLFLHNQRFRRELLTASKDVLLSLEWEKYDADTKQKSVMISYESPLFNRINRFVLNPKVRRMFCQRQSTFDPVQAMDEGKYVLVDLSSLPPEERGLVGRSIIDLFYQRAQRRTPGRTRPFFLVCDEFDEYASDNFGLILAKLRKFGVSTVLAHQSLDNLRARPKVYSAVKSNCEMFLTFRCSREDAEEMALVHCTGDFRDDIIIPGSEIKQTKFRPKESTRIIRSESVSTSVGESRGAGTAFAQTKGKAESTGIARTKGKAHHEAHAEGLQRAVSDMSGMSDFSSYSDSFMWNDYSGYSGPNALGHAMGGAGTFSYGSGLGSGTTTGSGSGTMSGTTHSDGTSAVDMEGTTKSKAVTKSKVHATSEAETEGVSLSMGANMSKSDGASKSVVPFYEHEEFQELSSVERHTPEAMKEYATARIYNQPKRVFHFRQGRAPSMMVKSLDNKLVHLPSERETAARQQILTRCAKPSNSADAELMASYRQYMGERVGGIIDSFVLPVGQVEQIEEEITLENLFQVIDEPVAAPTEVTAPKAPRSNKRSKGKE